MRKTKHSGIGHEDTGYSYVVIRRGARPLPAETKVGRLGEVGKRVMETAREKAAIAELMTSDEHPHSTADSESLAKNKTFVELSTENLAAEPSGEELQAALRSEAYSWPRLVFPPLKKAGHIIIDGCTSEGTYAFSDCVSMYLRLIKRRQDHANDNSQVTRETTVLRRPEVQLG